MKIRHFFALLSWKANESCNIWPQSISKKERGSPNNTSRPHIYFAYIFSSSPSPTSADVSISSTSHCNASLFSSLNQDHCTLSD